MAHRRDVLKPIVPQLKEFDCFDHDLIEDWRPESEAVLYWLTLHIGPPDEPWATLYQVAVCTHAALPEWKRDRRTTPKQRAYRPVVLASYSWEAVLEAVRERIAACRGFGWLDVQEKLRREFQWEYEGYGPRWAEPEEP